jgi:hypothetical protein
MVAAIAAAAPARADDDSLRAPSPPVEVKPSAHHPRVVLLSLTGDDPLAARLVAELEGLGLVVSRAVIDPNVPIEELVQQALAAGARGVVVADGRRTEFWVAEEGSDRVAMRQELEIESSPAMESVLSLRTVEFLRVSLGLTSRGAVVTPPVVPPPIAPPAEAEKRVGLELCAGVVGSTGRLAPFAAAGGSVRLRIVGPAGIELRGLAPLATQHLQATDGQFSASVWLGGGGLMFAPRMPGRVAFDAGAGAMAVLVFGSGTNTDGESRSGHGVGLALYGRAAGRFRLTNGWAVRLDALGGSTALRRPIAAIGMGGGDVTAWGVGFVAVLAGVEYSF